MCDGPKHTSHQTEWSDLLNATRSLQTSTGPEDQKSTFHTSQESFWRPLTSGFCVQSERVPSGFTPGSRFFTASGSVRLSSAMIRTQHPTRSFALFFRCDAVTCVDVQDCWNLSLRLCQAAWTSFARQTEVKEIQKVTVVCDFCVCWCANTWERSKKRLPMRLIQTVLIKTSVNGLMDHNDVNEGAVLLLLKLLQAAVQLTTGFSLWAESQSVFFSPF